MVDFTGLKSRFPYIALMPQVQFLEFITAQARRYPHFRLLGIVSKLVLQLLAQLICLFLSYV